MIPSTTGTHARTHTHTRKPLLTPYSEFMYQRPCNYIGVASFNYQTQEEQALVRDDLCQCRVPACHMETPASLAALCTHAAMLEAEAGTAGRLVPSEAQHRAMCTRLTRTMCTQCTSPAPSVSENWFLYPSLFLGCGGSTKNDYFSPSFHECDIYIFIAQ